MIFDMELVWDSVPLVGIVDYNWKHFNFLIISTKESSIWKVFSFFSSIFNQTILSQQNTEQTAPLVFLAATQLNLAAALLES